MGLFRAENLLRSVEAQVTLGPALEGVLASSPGQEAEFAAMLSTRHMARRMAGNPLTMTAINLSPIAVRKVFEETSEYNFRPIEEVAKNAGAMAGASNTLASIEAIVGNSAAFPYFFNSTFYDANIIAILTLLVGKNPANYTTISDVISDSETMAAIASSDLGMRALVESTPAFTLVSSSSGAMGDIAGNTNAMTLVANHPACMNLIAKSQIALDQVNDEARVIVSANPIAVRILASYEDAWDFILSTSTILATNIYNILIAFSSASIVDHANVESIFAHDADVTSIANSRAAMMAVTYDSATIAHMIASPHLDLILGSTVAMGVLSEKPAIMQQLIGDSVGFAGLLQSPLGKAAIFESPALMSTMTAAGSDSLAILEGLATTALGPVPDAKIGPTQSLAVAGNIIILTAKMGSIVATTLENTFFGATQTGSTFDVPGTHAASVYPVINLPFTDVYWDVKSIAATAAARVTITYVDFN